MKRGDIMRDMRDGEEVRLVRRGNPGCWDVVVTRRGNGSIGDGGPTAPAGAKTVRDVECEVVDPPGTWVPA